MPSSNGRGRETFELADVKLRAPLVPKKFFRTAGNFREHHEESKKVNWSHPVLPWIVFLQNVDAIIGPVVDGKPTPLSAGELAVIRGGIAHSASVRADDDTVASLNVWRLRGSV